MQQISVKILPSLVGPWPNSLSATSLYLLGRDVQGCTEHFQADRADLIQARLSDSFIIFPCSLKSRYDVCPRTITNSITKLRVKCSKVETAVENVANQQGEF